MKKLGPKGGVVKSDVQLGNGVCKTGFGVQLIEFLGGGRSDQATLGGKKDNAHRDWKIGRIEGFVSWQARQGTATWLKE